MLRWKCSGWCFLSVLAFVGAPVCRAQSTPVEVASPDHRITLRFTVQPVKGQETGHGGQLVYSVAFQGKAAFENSALGLELANQPTLGSAVHIAGSTPSSGVDDYTLIAGKASAIHDTYNSLTVHAAESASPGRNFDIEARVYNGAIAFRYHVPQQAALSRYQLTQEDTEFRPVMDAYAWALRLPNYESAYESEYVPHGFERTEQSGRRSQSYSQRCANVDAPARHSLGRGGRRLP